MSPRRTIRRRWGQRIRAAAIGLPHCLRTRHRSPRLRLEGTFPVAAPQQEPRSDISNYTSIGIHCYLAAAAEVAFQGI